jgi:hypothetical protein
MLRNLEKHQKYKSAYRPNDFFWGLGVEHETYFESCKLKQVSLKELKEDRKPERYCVNYYNIYDKETLDKTLDGLFNSDDKILLPILVNSHTFEKTDLNGEHKTTYERIPKPNPKFSGKTIFEWMKEQNPEVFAQEYEKAYIFDGDTIEFMTQKFYKAKVQDVIDELCFVENEFMRIFNDLPKEGILKTYGPFKIAQKNYPFATYLTNLKNNAMFNNGTIHINITLPTKLNEKCDITDFDLFKRQHQNLARAIQWISPLILSKYGSYDPLSESTVNGDKYAAGSQRVAVSRYIGLGTFDTDVMPVGKILTENRDKLQDLDWYESFHQKVDYKFLNELGMDINFNKHFAHGIEFRILDAIPMNEIKDILILMVHLADFSLSIPLDNPKKSKLWHKITEKCVHDGKGYLMDASDQNELFKLFRCAYLSKEPLPAHEVLEIITQNLFDTYKNGMCVKYMIHGEEPVKRLSPIIEIPSVSTESEKTSSRASVTGLEDESKIESRHSEKVNQPAPINQNPITINKNETQKITPKKGWLCC